jgi:hypothetical protein
MVMAMGMQVKIDFNFYPTNLRCFYLHRYDDLKKGELEGVYNRYREYLLLVQNIVFKRFYIL